MQAVRSSDVPKAPLLIAPDSDAGGAGERWSNGGWGGSPQMADPISGQVLHTIHSISDHGLIDDFLASVWVQRLTLPFHTQFPSLEDWKRQTQILIYLSRVSKPWFRAATRCPTGPWSALSYKPPLKLQCSLSTPNTPHLT